MGGEWEGRKVRTQCCLSLELMKVFCRAIYWVLSLEHVYQIEETKKKPIGLFSSAQKEIFSAFIHVLPRNITTVFVPHVTCHCLRN